MNFIKTLLSRHRLPLYLGAGILVVALIISQGLSEDASSETTTPPANPLVVSLLSPQSFNEQTGFSVLGKVAATDRAFVTAAAGGLITSIRVSEGDDVAAGTLVATLKNDSEQAAVAQAKAALRAAEAGAAQSNVGTASAESALEQATVSGRTSVSSSYSLAQRVVLNDIDQFFSNPENGAIGARVGRGALVRSLNEQRMALRQLLMDWESLTNQPLQDATNVVSALKTSQTYTTQVLTLVNTLITALNNESGGGNYSNAELRSLQSQLTQTRDGLLSNKNGQQGALTQINNARDQVAQATISGTNSELSSAQAQIDQARASLRSAESRLANTYLRAPIAGTVDALDLTLGQFIPGGTTIAEITNQNALEITTYVSTNERERIQTGNEVKIGTEYTGTITSIAPAADRASGKIRVTISTSEATFTIGSTVEVTFETQGSETSTTIKDTPLQIPITAIRFTGKETAVLQVDTEGVLYATPVILGDTVGNTINVVSGISSSTLLVRDVRGKQAGDMVTVESN